MIREMRALRKNGGEFDCEVAMSEVDMPAGNQRLFTVVMRDITERKQAEKAEAEAQANAARIEQLEQELHSLERLTSPAQTTVTAQAFGLVPLRESVPDTFNQLVERYGELTELALEQRAYRVNHNIPEELRLLAERVGFLKAGPRDVVEVHIAALREKTGSAVNQARAQAYIEEARVMVLQLMGHLVSHYRTYSVSTAAVKTREKPGRKRRTLSMNNENKYPVAKGG